MNGESFREEESHELRLSRASAGRLSLYLRCLDGFVREGIAKVSSGQLGSALGVTDAQVRKDLGSLGHLGQPGIGYPTQELITAIRRTLGLHREWAAAIVGIGNLARALLRYRGFSQQGFRIVALFDADPVKIGEQVDGLTIHGTEEIRTVVPRKGVELGVLAVPSDSAQTVAELLVTSGVRGILNFAPTVLKLPTHVSVVSVDLAIQLEQLAFLVQMGVQN